MSSFEPEIRPGRFVADDVQPQRGVFEVAPDELAPAGSEAPALPVVEESPAAVEEIPAPSDEDAGGEAVARAFEEGRAAGRAERPAEAGTQLADAASALEGAAQALAELQQDHLAASRRFVTDLAVAIAEKVIGRAVRSDPEVLASIVERAMTPLGEGGSVELSLSREDHETLTDQLTPTLDRLRRDFDIEVRQDPSLAPGDVRVGQGRAEVDARIAELLRRVREELDEDALFAEESP